MIEQKLIASQLRLLFYEGDNPTTGNPILRAKSFSNVKTSATSEQLYHVAKAFEKLQAKELFTIERRDQSEIWEG